MGGRVASRGAWTGATIAMPDGLTGAVTNGAAPPNIRSLGGVTHRGASEVRIVLMQDTTLIARGLRNASLLVLLSPVLN